MSIPPTLSTILTFGLGAYLAVAVVAYTDEPVVKHLACVPLHVHSTNKEELEAGERAVASLHLALADLRILYSSILSNKSRPRADFPFGNFFKADGCEHYFTYDGLIEDKRVFRTHLRGKEPTSLCIKFSQHYSEDVHRVTFNLGLAPKLYAINHVYGWFMVIMEDIVWHCMLSLARPGMFEGKLKHLIHTLPLAALESVLKANCSLVLNLCLWSEQCRHVMEPRGNISVNVLRCLRINKLLSSGFPPRS